MEFKDAEYQDKSTENVITKKELTKMTIRSMFLQASFNYERMQACGLLYGLLPGLKKIHKNKEDLSKSMKLHMEFFNTHPFLVTFIMGIVTAMEQNKENQETIRGIKIATMGPLGGIGDALLWLTALPITAGIGANIAINGNIAGPIVFLLLINIIHFALRFGLMNYGYKTGVKAIKNLKESTKSVSHAASIVGLTVVGALIASNVGLVTKAKLTLGASTLAIQEKLFDQVLPCMLPLVYTFLMYKLLKKGLSPVKLVLVTIVIGLIGVFLGIL